MAKQLELSEYTTEWAREFSKLKTYLDALLTDLVIDIIHVGSTSVVSLPAKPIIDVDIVYSAHLPEVIRILENNHYLYEGEKGIPNRHAFIRTRNDFYPHHLYVVKEGCDALNNHLALKRALQNNALYRQIYGDLKQKLIARNNKNRELYTNSKTDVISHILKEESLMKSIVLAGGCFWGVEAYFKQLDGVVATEAGYIAGEGETTYEEVCNGAGHAEAVLIKYDEELISLKKLLDHMFNIIDPTSINKQGNDVGVQYRSGIYNYLPEQLSFIKNYINIRQKEYNRPIMIELLSDLTFFPAEEYHQDYLQKNKGGYCHVKLDSYKNVK